MKIGFLAMPLTCALISAAGAATVTMTPPDMTNKQTVKPSVQAPPNVPVQPQVQTEPLPELASPRVIEAKPKVIATPSAPVTQPKPQMAAKPKMVAAPTAQTKPQAAKPKVVEAPRVMDAKPKVAAAPSAPTAQTKTQTAAVPKVVAVPSTRAAQPQTKFQNRLVQRDVRHRRLAHRAPRPYAGTYRYAAAAPWHQWHAQWAPAAPIVAPGEEGLRIDDRGWTGGVGYAPEGGGGAGFVDGYGQVHFANGSENGPSYNSYGQSFQSNPSQAGPFQPRLMGGFAPSSR